ncbi:MAG: hypothetical protein GX614_00810 [Sandaracinaceae bacterium]|nr:hypothetical protein [Sandaracinaceae bacterium]
MKAIKHALLTAVTLCALLAIHAPALAEGSYEANVLIVLAKEESGAIDPALRNLSALSRPPFNAFKTMELLDRPKLALEPGGQSELVLPNKRKLRIELVQVLPNGRLRVKVSIHRPDQGDYLPLLHVVASENDPFFIVGQAYRDGTLVIGVRISSAS